MGAGVEQALAEFGADGFGICGGAFGVGAEGGGAVERDDDAEDS